jgi:AcrR family transcriptional regulator
MTTMPTTKRRYHSPLRTAQAEATRRRVIEVALERFSQQGIDATSIGEIARAAGVAPETIYGAFGSKQGILEAIAAVASTEWFPQEAFQRRFDELAGDPRAQLRHLVETIGDFYAEYPAVVGLFAHASEEATAAFEGFREMLSGPGELPFTKLPPGTLREGVDPKGAFAVLGALLTPGFYSRMRGLGGVSLEVYKATVLDLLEHALLAPKA